MMASPSGRGHASSPAIVLAYTAAACAALIFAGLAMPWFATEASGHYYHPRLLALTHTVTLGWITVAIMGAGYHFVPILTERPVRSGRLARWQLAMLITGIAGMVGHFFIGEWSGLVWGAGLVALGVVAHVANLGLAMRGLRAWTFSARMVGLALAGLGSTAVFGLVLGLDHVVNVLPGDAFRNLHAHVQLALLGWVTPMVVALVARVHAISLAATDPDGWPADAQLFGLALGVPALVAGIATGSAILVRAGTLGLVVATAGHIAWLVDIAHACRWRAPAAGLRFVLTGGALLLPAAALGVGLAVGVVAGPRVALAYAVLAFGWASLTIIGVMLETVPGLVRDRMDVADVTAPALRTFRWRRPEGLAYLVLAPGIPALAVAVGVGDPAWIRAAGAVVAAGTILFGAAMTRTMSPLVRRRRPARGLEPEIAAGRRVDLVIGSRQR